MKPNPSFRGRTLTGRGGVQSYHDVILAMPDEKLIALTPRTLLDKINKGLHLVDGEMCPFHIPKRGAVLFVDVSGYTLVADTLQMRYGHANGAERLSLVLNQYFTRMISIVEMFGGEVPLFCGDAIAAVWLCNDDDIADAKERERMSNFTAQLALSCADYLVKNCAAHQVEDITMSIHLGLAHGTVTAMMLGGSQSMEQGTFKYMLGGQPMLDAAKGVGAVTREQLGIHEGFVAAFEEYLGLQTLDTETPGFRLYSSFTQALTPSQITERGWTLPLMTIANHHVRAATSTFLCDPALRFVLKNTIGELRVVSSVFICFYELSLGLSELSPAEQHDTMQAHFEIIQDKLRKYSGICNKVFQDDKGVLALCMFGLPGFVHDDDAIRSLSFALEVAHSCHHRFGSHLAIGVSRAPVFIGTCGGVTRFEYTALGDSVNVAARQMGYAFKNMKPTDPTGMVVCDLDTHKVIPSSCSLFDFGAVGQIKVRNKIAPIPVLKPRFVDPTAPRKDENALVAEIMASAKQLHNADRVSVFVVAPDGETLTGHFEDGNRVTMPISAGIAGKVATKGKTMNVADVYDDPSFNRSVDKATGYRTKSMLCMAVKDDENIVAVAQMINKKDESGEIIPFTIVDETLFVTFSQYIAVTLRNCRESARIRRVHTTKVIAHDDTDFTSPQCYWDEYKRLPSSQRVVERDNEMKRVFQFVANSFAKEEMAGSDSSAPASPLFNLQPGAMEPALPRVLEIIAPSGQGKTVMSFAVASVLHNLGVPIFQVTGGNNGQPFSALYSPLQMLVQANDIDRDWLHQNMPAHYLPYVSLLLSVVDIPNLVPHMDESNREDGEQGHHTDLVLCDVIATFVTAVMRSQASKREFIVLADNFHYMDVYTAMFLSRLERPMILARCAVSQVLVPPMSVIRNAANRRTKSPSELNKRARSRTTSTLERSLNHDDGLGSSGEHGAHPTNVLSLSRSTKEKRTSRGRRSSLLTDAGLVLPTFNDPDTERFVMRDIAVEQFQEQSRHWSHVLDANANHELITISLGMYSVAGFSEKLCEILNCKDMPRKIVEEVHRMCDGNLGFACELVRVLVQTEQLIIDENRVATTNGDIDYAKSAEMLSHSHNMNFGAVLDTLSEVQLAVIRICAIQGKSFLAKMVPTLCAEYESTKRYDDIAGILNDLVAIGLLAKDTKRSERLRFAHPILKDVVLAEMVSGERGELRELYHRAIEQHAGELLDSARRTLSEFVRASLAKCKRRNLKGLSVRITKREIRDARAAEREAALMLLRPLASRCRRHHLMKRKHLAEILHVKSTRDDRYASDAVLRRFLYDYTTRINPSPLVRSPLTALACTSRPERAARKRAAAVVQAAMRSITSQMLERARHAHQTTASSVTSPAAVSTAVAATDLNKRKSLEPLNNGHSNGHGRPFTATGGSPSLTAKQRYEIFGRVAGGSPLSIMRLQQQHQRTPYDGLARTPSPMMTVSATHISSSNSTSATPPPLHHSHGAVSMGTAASTSFFRNLSAHRTRQR